MRTATARYHMYADDAGLLNWQVLGISEIKTTIFLVFFMPNITTIMPYNSVIPPTPCFLCAQHYNSLIALALHLSSGTMAVHKELNTGD